MGLKVIDGTPSAISKFIRENDSLCLICGCHTWIEVCESCHNAKIKEWLGKKVKEKQRLEEWLEKKIKNQGGYNEMYWKLRKEVLNEVLDFVRKS